MPLKRNWPNRKKEEEKENLDLYKQLKREVQVVRKQSAPPEKDPLTFSKYVCDLCGTSHAISELKQCAVCGRWACENCWTEKFYLCNSCGGIVALKSIKL
jgi:rubrerythrin